MELTDLSDKDLEYRITAIGNMIKETDSILAKHDYMMHLTDLQIEQGSRKRNKK